MTTPIKEPSRLDLMLLVLVAAAYGAILSSFAWALAMPDQPPEPRICVPIYNETGLECCKEY
jgi:hypothetical protein